MSIGPLGGMIPSISGAPGAQRAGSQQERQAQEATASDTRQLSQQKAEAASGVGATEAEDQSPHERDADGRRLWEEPPEGEAAPEEHPPAAEDAEAEEASPGPEHDGQLDLLA